MRKPLYIISIGLACTSLLPGEVGTTIDRLYVLEQELVEAKQRYQVEPHRITSLPKEDQIYLKKIG